MHFYVCVLHLKKKVTKKEMRNLFMYWNEVISEVMRWKEARNRDICAC